MKSIFRKTIATILRFEANLVLKKYKPKIIGITGSVGKTSTKEAAFCVMSSQFNVRQSKKSYNSELGLPLSILNCDTGWNNPFSWLKTIFEGLFLILFPNKYPDWLILEMGVDRPGDMDRMVSWVKLDIAVVTRVGDIPVHVEFFKSTEELFSEKAKIVKGLKADGKLILNADDRRVLLMGSLWKGSTLTYGVKEKSDLHAENYHFHYKNSAGVEVPDGITFKLDYCGNNIPVRLHGVFGKHNIYSALAAMAIGISENMNLVSAVESLSSYVGPLGRLRIIEGKNNTIILDDTYNSSPAALNLALESLSEMTTKGKKVCILGDMMELGEFTEEAHLKAGADAAKVCDLILTVGPRARNIAAGASSAGKRKEDMGVFEKSADIGPEFVDALSPGDIVLVKGSQSVRMEKTVKSIMAHPEQSKKLLVRQEKEWAKR